MSILKYQTGGSIEPSGAPKKNLTMDEITNLPGEEFLKLDPKLQVAYRTYTKKQWDQGYRNPEIYNYKLTPEEREAYIKTSEANNPHAFTHTGYPSVIYANKNNGVVNTTQTYTFYEKPTLSTLSSIKPAGTTTAVAPTTTNSTLGTRYYLDPHTGQRLDPAVYGTFEGYEDKQLAQGADLITATLKYKNKKEEQEQAIAKNKELLATMTEEQKSAMRAAGMTPIQYFKSQELVATHEQGGIITNSGNLDAIKDLYLPPSSNKRKRKKSLIYNK